MDKRGNRSAEIGRNSDEFSKENAARRIGIFVAWPYCNGPRHVGHGAALVPADVAARYFRASDADVLMVSGTDEYGTPNMIAAEKKGMSTQEFVNQTSSIIRRDFESLGMSYDWFTRTTSPNHKEVTQRLFADLVDGGFISKGEMPGSYDSITSAAIADRYVEGNCPICGAADARGDQCDACTSLLEASDLVSPHSSLTGNPIEFKPVEHYFLNLDSLKDDVADFLSNNQKLRKEALKMSKNLVPELRPRAITRDIAWGIPLPSRYELGKGQDRVLYVWFEAVIGYLSASIEWAREQGDESLWHQWWDKGSSESYYFMGKDNVPFHTIIWPALIAAHNKTVASGETELAFPSMIASTGNLNFNGGKFSTSRGNVAYISDMLDIVGPDALRFYIIISGPENSDSNFALDELVTRYNDELVSKWGNLISRTTNLIERDCAGIVPNLADAKDIDIELLDKLKDTYTTVGDLIEEGRFARALKMSIETVALANKYISDEMPWNKDVIESGRARNVLATLAIFIENMTTILAPFVPHSSQQVARAFGVKGSVSPMPEEAVSSNGVNILTTRNPKGDLIWDYSEDWVGNTLHNGKAIIFARLDIDAVNSQFESIRHDK